MNSVKKLRKKERKVINETDGEISKLYVLKRCWNFSLKKNSKLFFKWLCFSAERLEIVRK
jgi:hypothetical protein